MADVRRIKVGDVVHRDFGDRCVDCTVLGFDEPALPLLHISGGGGVHPPTTQWHFKENCPKWSDEDRAKEKSKYLESIAPPKPPVGGNAPAGTALVQEVPQAAAEAPAAKKGKSKAAAEAN